jgi:hypothetical protein
MIDDVPSVFKNIEKDMPEYLYCYNYDLKTFISKMQEAYAIAINSSKEKHPVMLSESQYDNYRKMIIFSATIVFAKKNRHDLTTKNLNSAQTEKCKEIEASLDAFEKTMFNFKT